MDTISLSERLKTTTYLVNLYMRHEKCEKELISSGSAVAINSQGHLITAAHVILAAYLNGPYSGFDPAVEVMAKIHDKGFRHYVPMFCGYKIPLPDYLKEPVRIDIAVLLPEPPLQDVPFLNLASIQPPVGTQVLLAGYPDDLEMPFSIDRALNQSHPQFQEQRRNVEVARRSLMMVGSGMIGHSIGVHLQEKIHGWTMYIDNTLHSGASGGPVINSDGELVGIITQRAITAVSYEDTPRLRVPSGACLAISPNFATDFLKLRGSSSA